jgi:hypothetical protein
MEAPKQIQTEEHGELLELLSTSKPSFIQLKPLSHHSDHNIQRFPGLPQNIQERSLKLINTHFWEMCICLLGLRKNEERREKL